jgi:hypothetical protein
MHPLTEPQFRQEAEPMLRKVFVNDNQFGQPFAPNVLGRIIIYPCNGYIESPLIDAIVATAQKFGDTGCYISLLPTKYPYGHNNCYVPLPEFLSFYAGTAEEDIQKRLSLDMDVYSLDLVIYSSSGKWGVMTSHERHGLLGGSKEFISEIRADVPNLDQQVYGFLERLRLLLVATGRNPPDVTVNKGLSGLLAHVYGQQEGKRILQQFQNTPPGYYQEEF